MAFHFIDNTPQKHDSIDIQVLNEMIRGHKEDGPLAITDSEGQNSVHKVYPKEKYPSQNDHIPFIVQTTDYSNNLVGYIGESPNSSDEKNEPKRTLKMDGITNFYIGSLTIVGLYLLYRMIQKTR